MGPVLSSGFFAALSVALLAALCPRTARAADLAPRMLLLDGAVIGSAIIAVGERGTILRSTDQARTWQAVASPTPATLTAVAFAPDASHGWTVGHDAIILSTADAGRTWTKSYQGESLQDSFLDVLALDAQRVIAVGAYGLCVVTADSGKTWTRRKILDDDRHLNRLSRGPTGTLYLAGERGTLLRSADDGASWTAIAAPYDGSFYGILPLDKRTLVAHGLRGRAYRSADDGASWSPLAVETPALLATALKLKSNFLVLAGQARTLLVSRDYAATVAPWPLEFTTAVAKLLELADGSILALGEAGATVLPPP